MIHGFYWKLGNWKVGAGSVKYEFGKEKIIILKKKASKFKKKINMR